jgi:hypothetical protein
MSKSYGTVSLKDCFGMLVSNSIIFGQTKIEAVDLACILPIMPMTNGGHESMESTLCYEQ